MSTEYSESYCKGLATEILKNYFHVKIQNQKPG